MQIFYVISILFIVTMNVHAEFDRKQVAFISIMNFFNVKEQKLVFEGRFIETDSNYGEKCKVVVDFSKVGEEYLTIIGEHSPFGNIGDGIYFNENKLTFEQAELKNEILSLEQNITDSFSTGMKTKVVLTKRTNQLDFYLVQKKRFLFFFNQTIIKKCIVDNFNPKQGY